MGTAHCVTVCSTLKGGNTTLKGTETGACVAVVLSHQAIKFALMTARTATTQRIAAAQSTAYVELAPSNKLIILH